MANRLKMALIDSITTLHQQGWSQRRIARELGINRESVSRHLRQALAESKPPNAPTGSDTGAAASKVRRAGRLSNCEKYRQLIVGWCEQGLHCQRMYQDLVTEHGYCGGYYSVRRFVRRLQRVSELPMRRLECAPGEEVQVDFGRGAFVVDQDKRRRPHVFRVVLSYSRKGYSAVVSRQTTEAFLRCLENAFGTLAACRAASSWIRRLLERDAPRQELLAFAEQDPVIRPLSEYAQFVHDAFQKGATS